MQQIPRLAIRSIPDDNSCLFKAICHAIDRSNTPSNLRRLISQTIQSSQEYTEAILGMPKQQYIQWIMQPNSWGGAIELAILAKHYRVCIACVDVLSAGKSRLVFGESDGYEQIIYLLYSGIHYDCLVGVFDMDDEQLDTGSRNTQESASESGQRLFTNQPEDFDLSVFMVEQAKLLDQQAIAIAKECHARHLYTDTQKFSLKCCDCGSKLIGQSEASEHAAKTGHSSFEEV